MITEFSPFVWRMHGQMTTFKIKDEFLPYSGRGSLKKVSGEVGEPLSPGLTPPWQKQEKKKDVWFKIEYNTKAFKGG